MSLFAQQLVSISRMTRKTGAIFTRLTFKARRLPDEIGALNFGDCMPSDTINSSRVVNANINRE